MKKLGVSELARLPVDIPCEPVWLQAARNKGEMTAPSNSGVFQRVAINK